MPYPPEPSLTVTDRPVGIDDLVAQTERAEQMVAEVRSRAASPNQSKIPPTFTAAQVAALCGLDKAQFDYRVSRGILPAGVQRTPGARREYPLADAIQCVRISHPPPRRPEGVGACVTTTANLKGGCGKTTLTMALAQSLSLRGLSVLAIDLDPQGSLTTLFGLHPDADVVEEDTIGPLCHGDQVSLEYAVRETYWPGLDLIPACSALNAAEFSLPARQRSEPGFEFWNVLNRGLESLRARYDVILIDTPPSLGYLTVNSFYASNGLVIPLPPNALDFLSSASFWKIFSDVFEGIRAARNVDKVFDFVHVVLSRVDVNDSASALVRRWISSTYADKVLPVEIPKTTVASAASVEFGTLYDIARYEGNAKTYQRAREAFDRVADQVLASVVASWERQAQTLKG